MRKMQILVVTRDGRKSIYEVDRFGTVGQLKARIGRHLAVPMGFSRLAYKGRVLTNQSVLEDVGLKRMSTLELFWQPLVFTPKQFREKEMDLDKMEQKQRGTSSSAFVAETYDQMLKTGGILKSSGSFLGSQSKAGDLARPSCGAGSAKFLLPAASPSSTKLPDIEEEVPEELTSLSSDELDFLAAYRRPKGQAKGKAGSEEGAATMAETEADAEVEDIDLITDLDLDRYKDPPSDVELDFKSASLKAPPVPASLLAADEKDSIALDAPFMAETDQSVSESGPSDPSSPVAQGLKKKNKKNRKKK